MPSWIILRAGLKRCFTEGTRFCRRRRTPVLPARPLLIVAAVALLAGPHETSARADLASPGPPSTATVPRSLVRVPEVQDPENAARSRELRATLARLSEYVEGYERDYSMLVAEEDYRQSAPTASVRMRSDLLLVRPERSAQWISFRDVFEVNGRPVRDREERLRRLFLDPSAEAAAQLKAIREESARYNIGPVQRTINVPLFPLVFLRPANRVRLDFELAGRGKAQGVQVWRLRFVERARPTIVSDPEGRDVPHTGWFLVDRNTGAIVETGTEAQREGAAARIVVRYRRDAKLGLWVPADMRETYRTGLRYAGGGVGSIVSVEGHATYSNFRRFQVSTEEKITVPK
jgi:hypothetical protein